jgi:hypothetical protein
MPGFPANQIEVSPRAQQVHEPTRSTPPPPRPSFFGREDENPAFFLRELNDYIAHVPEHQKVVQATRCFFDNAANWANGIGASETSYGGFQEAFTRDFLGLAAQRKIRTELEFGSYVRAGRTSTMADYFLKMRAKMLRLSEHQPTDREFLTKISEHFPIEVGREIRSYRSFGEEAIHLAYQNLLTLDREEEMRRDSRNRSPPLASGNSNQNSTNNFNNPQKPPRYQDRNANPNQGRGGSANPQGGNRQVRSIFVNPDGNEEEPEEEELETAQVTHIIAKGEELLEDEVLEAVGSSPKVTGKIGQQTCKFLVDSGSEVSIISTKFYEILKKEEVILAELEGGNLEMQGPFGKSKKVKSVAQILVEVQSEEVTFKSVFVVTDLVLQFVFV